ncbi:MAG: glycosyltransferase family 4 protein [Spirochaetaceae bacterium]
MNKKILLIANTTGCLFNFRHGLIKRLLADGYSVFILAPYYSQEAYSKNAVTELKSWGVICQDIDFNSKGMNPIHDLKLVNSYMKEFKKIKPDVILSYTIKSNIYGSVAARKVGIPIINNVTGLGNLYANPTLITKVADILYKWGFKKSSTVFFQNQDDMDLFLERSTLKEEQCGRIPGSGINLELFKPEPKVNPSEKLKFLMIARLIWDKGVGYYVDAIKVIKEKYPNTEFQILGERGVNNPSAIPDETVDSWIESGLITYLGTSNDVREQIRECDCMVLPSIYREGVPRTLIEGSAMGKPIITTDNVGCRDIVQDGYNGYLCKKADSDDLALKIEKFINLTDQERLDLGKNGREKVVTEFNEEIVISKYMSKINSILGLKE